MDSSNNNILLPNQAVSVSKEVLAQLPVADYVGEIKIIDSVDEIEDAVDKLSNAGIIGFDTETKPTFRRGVTNKVSLIQLSTEDTAYLFRINKTGLDARILSLLTSEDVMKIGLSVRDDFLNLLKLASFEPTRFVDLQQYVKQFGIEDNSLQKIYAILFGQRITKGQRLSNWEGAVLTPAQQHYAALDAYACLKIYKYLESGQFDPTKSQYLINKESTQEVEHPEINEQ